MIIDDAGFDTAKVYDKFLCKCDYCGDEFLREKRSIVLGRAVINKESCPKCTKYKREESTFILYGVKNAGGTEASQEKARKTFLEKYGVTNAAKDEVVKEKIRKTNIERYGVSSYLATPENREKLASLDQKVIWEKSNKTILEKYGVTHCSKLDSWKENMKAVSLERYGNECFLRSDAGREATKKSLYENYGVYHPSKCPEIRQKASDTMVERYGVPYYSQSEEGKERFRNTCLEKYGVTHPNKDKNIMGRILKTKLEKYGTTHPTNLGVTEKSIVDWLNSYGFSFSKKILGGKEIDAIDENKKIGIEYCGLYWHNELSRTPRLQFNHYDKYKVCQKNEIRLITIFEDEWIHKQEKCKSLLLASLSVFNETIHVNKCKLSEITKDKANYFMDNNHLLGHCNETDVTFGIFNDEELVIAICLEKHQKELSITRLCSKLNTRIIGGASKLFSLVKKWSKENNCEKIITYSDNRWFSGKVYDNLGFSKEKELLPDYSYVDLTKKATRYEKQLYTEENIKLAKIWDCGKILWKYQIV